MAEQIDSFCTRHGIPPQITYAVNVSVDELLTNTIRYGYDDANRHRIEMTVQIRGRLLVVQIADDAKPYDPTAAPHPDINAPIDKRPIGGLGIQFVRLLMDSFRYRRYNGRNIVTITKDTGTAHRQATTKDA